MNSEDEHYFLENIEDKTLRYVAARAKTVLKENDILEKILQKYNIAYNKTSNEKCSSKTLQVMNQNHKPIFSTITSSGVIKSPRCSSASAKKDAKVPCIVNQQLNTPLKANRISSSKERKRLSFDVAENEDMKPVKTPTEGSDEGRMHIDAISSSLKHEDADTPHDRPEERFNPHEIPECVQTLTVYDQVAEISSSQTPEKDQTMVIPVFENRAPINGFYEEERNAWYLKSGPSLFRWEIAPKALNSPIKYIKERCNIEGKPETMTSQDMIMIYDHDNACLPTESLNHQAMVTSPENRNVTLENCANDDTKSDGCSPFKLPFSSSKKEAKVSDKHKTNEQDSLQQDKSVSSLSLHHLNTSSVSYKTPQKLQTVNANTLERTPTNQNVVKKVIIKTDTNDKECSTPLKDVKVSNNPNMKKRKSVDYSEEAVTSSHLVHDDQEFKVPAKISKLNNELTTNVEKSTIYSDVSVINGNESIPSTNNSTDTNNCFHSVGDSAMIDDGYDKMSKLNNELTTSDEKASISGDFSVMNGNSSICSINESPMDDDSPIYSVDNSAMDCNDDSLNRPDAGFTVDHGIAKSEDKSIISALHINNSKSRRVTPDKKSERSINPTSVSQNCVSLFSFKATSDEGCLSPIKDVKTSNNKVTEQKSIDNLEDVMTTNLDTEDQVFKVTSKISKLDNGLAAVNEKSTISGDISVMNDNISSADESSMDAHNSLHSAMDCNDSFKSIDNDFIAEKDIAKSDKSSLSDVYVNNSCKSMYITPDKKSERSAYQASIKQNSVSPFSPEGDQKKAGDEVESVSINSKCDKIKTGSHETKDVESLTNLMQNLSPSVKRSSGESFNKSMTESLGDKRTLVGKLGVSDSVSKATTPLREGLISNELSVKASNLYAIQAVKFIEILKQRKARFSMYLQLFNDDQHDLGFICGYIEKLADVLKEIPVNENNLLYINAASDFADKAAILQSKGNSWRWVILWDLKNWEDCIEKVNVIQQNVKQFCREKKLDKTPKDFKKWDASFREVNKKADDMILLREIKRPTIIQFGYEVENLIQLFIQCLLAVGVLKTKIFSD